MKNIFSKLLTVVLALALFVNSVMAATITTGDITIKSTTNGKTYGLYRMLDAVASEDGEKVAYSIKSNSAWYSFISKYLVDENNTDNTLTPVVIYSQTASTKDTVKYLNLTDANIVAFANAAHDFAKNLTADKTVSGTGSDVTVKDLPLGYYLIFPYGATEQNDESDGSIVSINTNAPSAEVVIKAKYPEINKTADDISVEVGQVVNFEITGNVPDTTGYKTYTYKVSDVMSDGLTFNKDVVVTIGGTAYTPADGKLVYANDGFTLTFDNFIAEIANEELENIIVGAPISIKYTATVNDNAVMNIETNTAKLDYTHRPTGETTNTPPVVVYLYSAQIEVLKVDGADEKTLLKGAEFVLRQKGTNKYYKYTAATETAKAKVSWVVVEDLEKIKESDATIKVTDENGYLSFDGLEDGNYELVEITAPEGYNLLTDPIDAKITNTIVIEENGKETLVNNAEVKDVEVVGFEATVKNYTGAELPSTGGIGTTLFVTFGSIIALGAALVFVTNKRMAKEFN